MQLKLQFASDLHLEFPATKVDKAIKRDLHNKVEGYIMQKLL